MSEWLKEHAWKACIQSKAVSRVRIPLSPPNSLTGRGNRAPASNLATHGRTVTWKLPRGSDQSRVNPCNPELRRFLIVLVDARQIDLDGPVLGVGVFGLERDAVAASEVALQCDGFVAGALVGNDRGYDLA